VRVSGEMPMVVVAAPAYLARLGESKTPRELAAHDCIRFRLPSGAFVPWRFRIKRRTLEVHVNGRLIVNDDKRAIRAAIEGLQLPPEYVAPQLAAGRLITVLDGWAPPPVDALFLYYPSRRLPALKTLVDFFREARRNASGKPPVGFLGSGKKSRSEGFCRMTT
jgi:DNA-binding transcriptional LysR family regulator